MVYLPYILHWVDFFWGKNVGKYNSPMDPMGFPPVASLRGEEPFGWSRQRRAGAFGKLDQPGKRSSGKPGYQPIPSMYGIYLPTCWSIFMVDVGKSTSPMDGMCQLCELDLTSMGFYEFMDFPEKNDPKGTKCPNPFVMECSFCHFPEGWWCFWWMFQVLLLGCQLLLLEGRLDVRPR